MTRHCLLLALAAGASLAIPGAALADDDDVGRILRGFIAPGFHVPGWDRDDDNRRWGYSHRIRHDDDDRWDDDDDDDDDDRRGRRGDDDDDD
ncbi:hypothetical protein [Paracoccus fontiphilus]|uniref:Uncharacterized protein n=1 Tax=Paracoccus fontiphilus TaxID=1815556 RepID=A0ABV7INP2_9RHOB|nr:hypothetical protein [Paracoccus fontiphilus]